MTTRLDQSGSTDDDAGGDFSFKCKKLSFHLNFQPRYNSKYAAFSHEENMG